MQTWQRLTCAFVIGQLAILAGCGPQPQSGSDLKTVDIPQSPVENQAAVGFCWSYATMGLIESRYKATTGKDVRLSPEALGFYRMAEGLYELTRIKNPRQILDTLKTDDLQGFNVMSDDRKAYHDAMSLLQTYGVVPESVWSYKFMTDTQVQTVVIALKANLVRLVIGQVLKGRDATGLTRDDIINKVMTGPGAFPKAPPKTFPAPENGQTVTAVDYMRKNLAFQPEAYGFIEANDASGLPAVIAGLKRTVVRGVDGLLAFPVNTDRLHGNAFTGKGVDLHGNGNFTRDGGHEVLVTDFVNKGSKAGALKSAAIASELKRPASDLDQFVFKNSWGQFTKKDAAGHVVLGSATGYYTIDYEYLEGSVFAGADVGGLQIVVPADIAANPFGDEPVNAKVAAP